MAKSKSVTPITAYRTATGDIYETYAEASRAALANALYHVTTDGSIDMDVVVDIIATHKADLMPLIKDLI